MTLRTVLEEQIKRNHRNSGIYREKLLSLSKGSIHVKKENGRDYYYLKTWDSEGKRVARSIREEHVEIVRHELATRKRIEQWIREIEEDIKIAEKALATMKIQKK